MRYMVGIIFGVIIIYLTVRDTAADTSIYWSFMGLIIVFGGTFCSGIITFSFGEMMRLFTVLRIAFKPIKLRNTIQAIDQIIDIAKGGLQPPLLTTKIKKLQNLFFKDAIQMIVDGIPREKIIEILHARIEEKIEAEKSQANIIRTISKYPAAYGMIGTVIGLVSMLRAIGSDESSKIGLAMSIALLANLYGLILGYMILVPIADNLEHKTYVGVQTQKMILHGVDLLFANENPVIIREALMSYLPPKDRKRIGMKKE